MVEKYNMLYHTKISLRIYDYENNYNGESFLVLCTNREDVYEIYNKNSTKLKHLEFSF